MWYLIPNAVGEYGIKSAWIAGYNSFYFAELEIIFFWNISFCV